MLQLSLTLFEITTITSILTLFDERSCRHAIGHVGMASIETGEAVHAINLKSNSGTARKHDWRKGGLFRDFEDLDFLHLETERARQKRFPVQSGVVRVTLAKAESGTALNNCLKNVYRSQKQRSLENAN
jgi:hypothetical protein